MEFVPWVPLGGGLLVNWTVLKTATNGYNDLRNILFAITAGPG
jgi:hypothetical protein